MKNEITETEQQECGFCMLAAAAVLLCAAVVAAIGFYARFRKNRNYYESWRDYDNCGMF